MKTRDVTAVLLAMLLATVGVASALPNSAVSGTPTDGVPAEGPATEPMTPDDRSTDRPDETPNANTPASNDTAPSDTPDAAPADAPTAQPETGPDVQQAPEHVTLPAAAAPNSSAGTTVSAASNPPTDRPARGPDHELPESVPEKVQTIHLTIGQYLDDAVTGRQGHAVSAVASADAANSDPAADDSDADGVGEATESDSDRESANSVDETVETRGPASLTERFPDHVEQVHQAVRDILASLFGGANDE
ncbi:hypothetical protein SAMN04487949_0759 [Halogranum gelatinilyticum]|uniref:Uncharacterized protein n=1 Tax=Halogranum gelatinilyticum TaxID=660521 RepID=A0A1G9QAB0_9EURY|nr:hypothetical protein [Halogranum gelatinilyticum]SDM07850.1 hypothetical protein SAMN04487949_0759 [Halogranum gelatinilyticum]